MARKQDQEEIFQPIKHLSGGPGDRGRGQLINMELFPNEAKPPFLSSRQSISGMEVEFLTFDSVMRLREPISLNFRLYKNRKESEWTHFVP